MKIIIDTNVLISAFVFHGKAGSLLDLLLVSRHQLLTTEYIDHELKAKLEQKWPEKANTIYTLYLNLPIEHKKSVKAVVDHNLLRDQKDIQVLQDALYYDADVILSGDKDFIDADLDRPLVLSPADLYDFLI
ncbi:putative toxin-antitoxin system toxin component, PIN family [bacterium]|nr:putative toxin-antitoxin system toxin component, PIN family [bacterium]